MESDTPALFILPRCLVEHLLVHHRLHRQLGASLDLLAVPREESSGTVLIGRGDLRVDHAFCFFGAMHVRARANDLNWPDEVSIASSGRWHVVWMSISPFSARCRPKELGVVFVDPCAIRSNIKRGSMYHAK